MDFKSLMAAQISKAKGTPSPGSTHTTSSTATNTPKYLRRAEIEAQRQATYLSEQEAISREREERARKKRKLEEDATEEKAAREAKLQRLAEESRARREESDREEERARRKRLGLPDLPAIENGEGESPVPANEDIADDELQLKLREMSEPAIIFGESHRDRLKRHKALVAKALAPKMSKGPIPTTVQLVEEKDMRIPEPDEMPIPESEGEGMVYRQLASWFTLVLREWAIALSQRSTEVKESNSGIQASNNHTLVLRDLTPLFRRFEAQDLAKDKLLEPIVEIVRNAQKRRYVDANDGYLRLSIGKAAWPIGVTMVGIHERSAREKLHETDKQAHIMSDEGTRKWLQGIKRCLSFAQTRWLPGDGGQLMG